MPGAPPEARKDPPTPESIIRPPPVPPELVNPDRKVPPKRIKAPWIHKALKNGGIHKILKNLKRIKNHRKRKGPLNRQARGRLKAPPGQRVPEPIPKRRKARAALKASKRRVAPKSRKTHGSLTEPRRRKAA